MNRREAAELSAYAAAVKYYKANAIMCHLMPGDTFSFPHSPEAKYIAGKSCWYRREDGTGPAYRTGRLAAVILISHAKLRTRTNEPQRTTTGATFGRRNEQHEVEEESDRPISNCQPQPKPS